MKYIMESWIEWLFASVCFFLVYKDLRQDVFKLKTDSLYVADIFIYILCLPLTILILLKKFVVIRIK